MSGSMSEHFHLCTIVSKGNVFNTKYGARCELLVEVMKTTCAAFEKAHRIKVITWKDKADQAAKVHQGQKYLFFFTKYKNDVDWSGKPIQAITATKIVKATKSDVNMYFINSNGQYDPFSKLII